MFINFYKNYLLRPSTKFFTNIFFLKYAPSTNIDYNLTPSQIIEASNSLTSKIYKEITVIQFYNWSIICLYVVTFFEIIYLYI